MTFEELIAEGHRLEKSCLYLTDEPNENGLVGYWGEEGPSNLPDGYGYDGWPFKPRHWITLDCAWIKKQGGRVEGIVSVYEKADIWQDPETNEWLFQGWLQEGDVIWQYNKTLKDLEIEGEKLYGLEGKSFPPIQAVCLYGSEKIEAWLREQNLKRTDYDALHGKLADRYHQYWIERSPILLQNEEYVAVMGGWHAQWQDDFYMPAEMELVVCTARDSEPWVEVWARCPNFRVEFRIT